MQFIINNWYLFVGLAIVLTMLLMEPLSRYMHGIKTLGTTQAVQFMNQAAALVVDVREPDEFKSGHIPNAMNVPLSRLVTNLADLEKFKDRPMLVSCRTSQRSLRAAVILRKNGFENVQVLAGGLVSWQAASLPTTKS